MRAHHGSTSVIEPAQHMNHHYHQQHGLAGGAGGSAVYPNVGFPGTGAMPTSALPPQPMTLPVSSTQHAIHYNNSNYATTPAPANAHYSPGSSGSWHHWQTPQPYAPAATYAVQLCTARGPARAAAATPPSL